MKGTVEVKMSSRYLDLKALGNPDGSLFHCSRMRTAESVDEDPRQKTVDNGSLSEL